MKLKEQVERILQLYPESRNSDITLMILLWERYFPQYLIKSKVNDDKAINVKSLFVLPREDHIKRYRAKIQNIELKYLPTEFGVVKQRKINEGVWREEMAKAHAVPQGGCPE